MKVKKVGKAIAIFLLIILVLVLGYLVYNYFYGGTKEQKIERKLKKMTKSFYEDYYYDLLLEDKGSSDKVVEYLSKFSKTGLKISFDSLKAYYDQTSNMNYTELTVCDEIDTKVIIYPKEPYGKTDYTMEYKLSCDLEEPTEDMIKFKKDFEDVNNLDGKKEVFITNYNLVKYSSLEEINKMISEKKSFVVFLGNPFLEESRYTIESFINTSKDNNIDTIYYVDIIKDYKEENDIRTVYALDNGVVTKVKDGTAEYIKFVQTCKDILPVPFDEFIDVNTYQGDKTILNSAFIYVEKGVPTIYTDGLPHDTQDYTLVEESTIDNIFNDFYKKRKTN